MKISQLRKRSNKFVKELPTIIEGVVNGNKDLLNINKAQLWASKTNKDQRLTPKYSNSYRAWKQRNFPSSYNGGNPNAFLSGKLHNDMEIDAKGSKYDITSKAEYSKFVNQHFKNGLYGIAPSNQKQAQSITSKLIANEYRRKVLA